MSDFARTLAPTVAGVLILLVSLWYGRHLQLLVFGGVLFAVSLRGISDRLGDAARVDRRLALWLVVFAVFAGLVGASVVAEPYLADQVQTLAARLPPAFDRLRELVERSALGRQLGRTLPSEVPDLSTTVTVAQASPVVGAVAGGLFDFAVVFFLGIYFAAEPRAYTRWILGLAPDHRKEQVREGLHRVRRTLEVWLLTRVLAMALLGVGAGLSSWALGVPMAALLGLIAGVTLFVPYLGAILAAIPAALVALMQSPLLAVLVLLLYTALHVVEGYLLSPLVQRKAVEMPPVLDIVAQILFAMIAGVLGMILATPLLAAGLAVARSWRVASTEAGGAP